MLIEIGKVKAILMRFQVDSEEKDFGNWSKDPSCYKAAKNVEVLPPCPRAVKKAQVESGQPGYLPEETPKH